VLTRLLKILEKLRQRGDTAPSASLPPDARAQPRHWLGLKSRPPRGAGAEATMSTVPADPMRAPVENVTAAPPEYRTRPPPGSFEEHIFRCPAGTRHFKLFIPGPSHTRPMPLVVMLHGCKQTPDDFALGTRMNEFAQRYGFAVVYPAQSRLENIARCWNWFRPSDQSRGSGEPAIIAALTLDVAKAHRVDSDQIFIAGMSAGGAMALIMVSAYPEIYAAAAVHSGVVPGLASNVGSALSAMRYSGILEASDRSQDLHHSTPAAPRLIAIHGDVDKTVSVHNGLEACARRVRGVAANALHATVENQAVVNAHPYTRTQWKRDDGQSVAELWIVHGGGHAWFGGDSRGSHTDPLGPDATRAVVHFFGLDRAHGS